MNTKPYIITVLQSHYCQIVFLATLFVSYFLIPAKVFYGWGYVLAISFMLVFALSLTCIIRNVKERILLAKTYKQSIWQIVLIILGLSAFQVCGIGAPICGATVGLGMVSIIFPGVFINFLDEYYLLIILFSIILQLISLYFMKCFKLERLVKQCADIDND